jgi:hypothetical protein
MAGLGSRGHGPDRGDGRALAVQCDGTQYLRRSGIETAIFGQPSISEAKNTAMLAMSSGSISPTRCAAASFVTRGLPGSSRPRTRSVIVADGAIALTRTLWGANSTAIERVIAAMPPCAAV